jgi:hypothetical protein
MMAAVVVGRQRAAVGGRGVVSLVPSAAHLVTPPALAMPMLTCRIVQVDKHRLIKIG